MIEAAVGLDAGGRVRSFTVRNHGRSEICAAVSMFALNTVNSVEALTEQKFICESDKKNGFIRFETEGEPCEKAAVLLESLLLGLRSVKQKYGNKIVLKEEEFMPTEGSPANGGTFSAVDERE